MTDETYWNGNGKYQELADKLDPLIPREGEADKFHIEMYRIMSRLYCDYHNNRLGNFDVMQDWYDYLKRFVDVYAHIATAEAYCIYDAFEAIQDFVSWDGYAPPSIDGAMESLADVITRWAWGVEAGVARDGKGVDMTKTLDRIEQDVFDASNDGQMPYITLQAFRLGIEAARQLTRIADALQRPARPGGHDCTTSYPGCIGCPDLATPCPHTDVHEWEAK